MILGAACGSNQQHGYQQEIKPLRVGEYTGDVGPTPVGVIPTALLHDQQRNKDVDISIDYPTRGGPFPVIVFSPGYGGSNSSYEPLVSYWASNGYVVIRPSHADAGALRDLMRDPLQEVYQQGPQNQQQQRRERRPLPNAQQQATPPPFRPSPAEAIWEKEREPQWRDRAADIKLILDSLNVLETRFPELALKLDTTRVAVGGHSYGAFTALLVAGVETFGNPPLQLGDPRVKAVLAMSPPGASANRGLTPQSWANLRIPAMFMTGTLDLGATETENANWRKQAFDDSPAGDKYFVLIDGARSSTFTGLSGSAFDVRTVTPTQYPTTQNPNYPMTVPQPGTPQSVTAPAYYNDRNLFQKVKVTSLIFWDAYLKTQAPARELLTQDKMPSGVTITKK